MRTVTGIEEWTEDLDLYRAHNRKKDFSSLYKLSKAKIASFTYVDVNPQNFSPFTK